jgi:ankyrin repeat protein
MNRQKTTDRYRVTALMRASEACNVEEVTKLIANGANVNDQSSFGKTALMYALGAYTVSMDNKVAVVKLLIEKGASVQTKDENGCAAIHHTGKTWTQSGGFISGDRLVPLLIASGSDVSARDNKGETAFMRKVSAFDDVPLLEALLAAGADVNAKNNNGQTALFREVKHLDRNGLNRVEFLLKKGADANARDKTGKSILSAVPKEGQGPRMFKLLKEYGATL